MRLSQIIYAFIALIPNTLQYVDNEAADWLGLWEHELGANCSNYLTRVYTPFCSLGRTLHPDECSPMGLDVFFKAILFRGIDNREQVLTMMVEVKLSWTLRCNNFQLPFNNVFFKINEQKYWRPILQHTNAAANILPEQMVASTRFFYEHPERYERPVIVWDLKTVLTSTANLDLHIFPFDMHNLEVNFEIGPASFLRIDSIEAITDETFVPKDFGWTAGQFQCEASNSSAKFTCRNQFQRTPDFYVYVLLIPCCLFTSLQLFSMFLEPHKSDRSDIAVTLLLALTLLHSEITSFIPVKPGRTFIGNYSEMCTMLAWFCTVYSMVACGITSGHYKLWWMTKSFRHIPRCRYLDMLMFTICLTIFMAINIYALSVAKEANFI